MDAPIDNPSEVDDSDVEAERAWRCAGCDTPVTDPRQLVGVDGGDPEQTFPNPAGIVFTILTVRKAWNVALVGPPSTDFSWFPGRSWRIVVCGGCGRHLGWFFAGQDRFFGLVRERLRR